MKRLLCSAVVLIAFTLPATAAELSGVVTSATQPVPVSGVKMTLRGADRERTTATDSQGAYAFTDLADNSIYTLEAVATGFNPLITTGVRTSSTPVTIDLKLELTEVRDSIVVNDGVITLNSNAPGVTQTVTSTELRELPSNFRSVNRFALLDPHVRSEYGQGVEGNNGARLSINASTFRQTNFLLDGVINYDWIYGNGPFQAISLAASEDVQVLTNSYAAQYGTSTSGTVKVTTRSGSPDLHGEAFAFVRPSGIQAAPPLSPFGLPNEREQWGGILGGPLTRNTFYFLSYEQSNQQRGAFIQSPVPSSFLGHNGEYLALTRFDHYFASNHAIFLRLNGEHFEGNNPTDRVSGFSQPNAARLERNQSWGGQFADHHAFGGTLNDFRVNYTSYVPFDVLPVTPSIGISRPSYSVQGNSTSSWVHAKNIDFSELVAVNHGRYSLKFGAEATRILGLDYSYTAFGTYTFAAGAPTPGQQPLRYAQTFGTNLFTWGETAFNAFAQADIILTPRLSANLGVRYEYQSTTDGLHNLGPRAGLAWNVGSDGKTTIRAGAGIFYDQLPFYFNRLLYSQGPFSPQKSYTIPFGTPGFPTFPDALTAPPTTVAASLQNLYIRAQPLVNPYSLQFSLGVERQLGHHFVLSLDAIHNHTLKIYRPNDLNHPAPFIRTANGQVRSGTAADATRPFKTYMGVPIRFLGVLENSNSSLYDAIDIGVRRKAGNRFIFQAHYLLASNSTYSSYTGDGTDSGIPSEWNNWGPAERGPSDFYQRHRFIASGLVNLPWKTRLGLTASVASGLPVNPLTGTDNNGDGYSSDRPVGLGRDSFRGPMLATVDMSGSKDVRITERLRAELRISVFNLLNRNNYLAVNNIYGQGSTPLPTFLSPIAGINNTDPSRQIQFGVRLVF